MKPLDPGRTADYKKIENPGDDKAFVENYNVMVDELNKLKNAFPVGKLSGQILDASIGAGAEVRISHSLQSTPKYRLLLRQVGNGVITDVNDKWNDKYVTLKNNGLVAVDITVMLIRE
jgi:hypothetical protein